MLASLDASLARLGPDHFDLWLAHFWDEHMPLEETLGVLDHAVCSGRLRYAGVSNYKGRQLARAATLSEAPMVAKQLEYSLLERAAEQEVIPAAEHVGAGLLRWAPLGASGRLWAVAPWRGSTGDRSLPILAVPAPLCPARWMSGYEEKYVEGRRARIVQALVTAAKGLGRTPLDVALGWLL